ncbi:MAG: ABC transporter substrate-binding protein [Bacteroidetes bacterium]|nr:ABC transporter substrate-binding protein [Bacteroidota bacterium]
MRGLQILGLIGLMSLLGCSDDRRQLVENAPLISIRATDSQGELFRFLEPPRRIVALSAYQAGWLAALGGKDLLVGVPEHMRMIELLEHVPRLRTLPDTSFDWEGLKSLKPDLILAGSDVYIPQALKERARTHGLRIFIQSSARVEDILAGNDSLAALLGLQETTRATNDRLRRLIAGMRKTWEGETRPRAVIILSAQPLVIAAGGHFLTDMAQIGGAAVLGADRPKPFVQITSRELTDYKPEIVYMVTEDLGYFNKLLAAYPDFIHLPAVVRKKLMALPPAEYLNPGPHLPATLLKLAGVAFPEKHLNELYLGIYHPEAAAQEAAE